MTTINTGRKRTRAQRGIDDLRASSNIHLAFVKNTADPQRMGRLQVWIPELGPDDPATWITVSYAAPFAGASPVTDNVVDDRSEAGSQSSYGIWATHVDVGNQVLVCFVNGDAARGYWFGSVYAQNMNHMVPGVGMNVSTDPQLNEAFAPYSPPVAEYNKKDTSINPASPVRPAASALATALLAQGLSHDQERGVSNTSARREDTSRVQGWLTPGGNSISFDDDPANAFIRFRTKHGAQIMISDTSGYIYAITKEGKSWVEISDGAVEIYSSAPVSIRSEDDVNIQADKDLNLDARGDINLNAGGAIRAHSGGATEIAAGGALNTQAGGNASHSAGGSLALGGGGAVGISAGGALVSESGGANVRNGSEILDNSGGGSAVAPAEASFKEASSIGDSTGRATICSRSPAHEPYHHPINATVSTAPAGSGAGAGGAGTIKRADGTLVQGVTEPDNTPVQKIGGYKVSDRVNGCIYQASRRTGVPYTTMMAMAAAESSFNPNAGASSSSAKGLYQFVGGTWDTMQKRYGPNGTVVKNPGVSTNIFDPCGNALMGAYYIKENAAALSAAGLGTSPTELYCCHFLGTGGGRRFLRAVKANPNALSNQSVDGRAFRANRSIFVKQNGQTRTNQEVYNILHAKTGATVPQWAAYQKSHSTNK